METPRPSKAALRLLHDGALAFARMTRSGVRIDKERLEATALDVARQTRELAQQLQETDVWQLWQKTFAREANLDSADQLAVVLFDKLHLPCISRTEKTGRPSATEKALLATGHPFAARYVAKKKLEKLGGTFLKGIQDNLCPDGRLRPSYLLHTAVTYRSSSKNPNSQNFPKRNKGAADLIRQCFVASPGRRVVEVDFSRAEVKVAACYTKDPKLVEYETDPTTDMHRDVACELFFLSPDQVDKRTTRDWTKNRFVFPQFYGSAYFQCAPSIWEAVLQTPKVKEHLAKKNVTELGDCDPQKPPRPGTFVHHVKRVADSLWDDRFPVFKRWKRSWYEQYLRDGFIRTLTGFVCEWAGGEGEGDKGIRLPKRNDVLNYAIQGSAFHCLLWCLIQTMKWLDANDFQTMVIGQIHDSMLLDVCEDELQEVLSYLDELMTVKLRQHYDWLIVPMAVEFEVSALDGNWGEQKQWTNRNGLWGPAA